ncbi:hypothetical protein CLHUN_19740 [Ruminiclostridium hungatei]|uniref:Uncharacterized protein n=1 Tax=Ruminiclostridium hungatei TaxID=48256 RepID=A0A1V4SL15_RUMHU|nr:hypothetical protein [Ruminiclostridium hungatei]OPX44175.1 hypothetical protein CLHUN_19740 [Ruminiclostridium hungatei]
MKTGRHTALIAAAAALAVIALLMGIIIGKRDNQTLYLKDIQGNSAFLRDITVSGVVRDKYHGLRFSIRDGKVDKNFSFYDSESDMERSQWSSGNWAFYDFPDYVYNVSGEVSADANLKVAETPSKTVGDRVYSGETWPQPESTGEYTDRKTLSDKIDLYVNIDKIGEFTRIKFKSGLSAKSDKMEFEFTKTYRKTEDGEEVIASGGSDSNIPVRKGNQMDSIVEAAGNLYFTIPAKKSSRGSNGIYRIDEWSVWPDWDNKKESGRVTELAGFRQDNKNTEVVALKCVQGKLVLVLLIEDVLTFRAYEPETGELIDQLEVRNFGRSEISDNVQFFVNENNLNLCFKEEKDIIVGIKLDKKLTLEYFIQGLEVDGETYTYLENVSVVNNKLLIFCGYAAKDSVFVSGLRPENYFIFAYDRSRWDSRLLYKGEVISDAVQDLIYRQQNGPDSGGFDTFDARRFCNVKFST